MSDFKRNQQHCYLKKPTISDTVFVNFSGCYSHPTDMDKGYPEFGFYLNRTGRPMVYACSWPVYQTYSGMTVSKDYQIFIEMFNNGDC